MASTPRGFRAGIPSMVTVKWNYKLKLFDIDRAVVLLFLKLLAAESWRCGVAILSYDIRPNHLHLIAIQYFDNHRPTTGISAMMRNILSQEVKAINRETGHEGSLIQSTFHSVNLPTLGDYLRRMAYIHGQDQHHRGPGLASSRPTLLDVTQADGLVYQFPLFPTLSTPDATPAERSAAFAQILDQITDRACQLEQLRAQDEDPAQPDLTPEARVEAAQPWHTAMTEAAEHTGIEVHADIRQLEFRSMLVERDPEAWFTARALLRHWRFPALEIDVQPRTPRVGDIIDIRIIDDRQPQPEQSDPPDPPH